MRRFMHAWVTAMVLIAVLVSCTLANQQTTTEPAATDGELIGADAERVAAPDVSAEQPGALVTANNRFAADLYHIAAGESDDNLIFSPYSISLAFSMVYGGARGDTEAEMQDVLHFLLQDEQHLAFNALDRHMNALSEGVTVEGAIDGETGQPFQLDIANAVWGQEGFPFQEEYLRVLAEQYGAGLRAADFAEDPEGERQVINDWIAEATQERIEDMVGPGVITPNTRMVLANAIYFYGGWLFPFNESATEDGSFTLLDGSTVRAPLMRHRAARVPYLESDGYRAVQLPYTGLKADMLILLPDEGRFAEIQETLDAELIAGVRSRAETRDVDVILPRYDFETELDLIEQLEALGMSTAFGSGADFSGMVEGGGLFIGAALHKATIAVDERGTEAAAATVIAMEESAMPPGEFHATRPFIFAIVERETGSILFLGRVMNPAEG
ncbi:MAG TPA: serpin family protein [Candidatus Sulfomarinibacteraceae bacterium]|nr:serpin family protein [Candidatus Sulfomarinibacteraceae bacterium]